MMKKNILTTFGSIATAVFASLCCIGPAILALAGASVLPTFSVFEKYRSMFIGCTAILLGIAFYMTYRKWEVKCEDGSCRVESAGKWNKIGVWCATFIAAAAITYPYFIKAQMPAPKDIFSHQSHVILDIEGMTCSSCAVHLQNKLIDMNSVHSAMVNYETRKANIAFDSLEITPEMLAEHVNKTGYKATLSKNNKGTIK